MITVCRNIPDGRTAVPCITHGGIFHADEVLATAVLEMAFGSIAVCRTFAVPNDLPKNTVVYDIGAGELDHHQKGGNGTRKDGVPYASAGLVWRKFGKDALSKAAVTEDAVAEVWHEVDRRLVRSVDAVDTGYFGGTRAGKVRGVDHVTLSDVVASFNPSWDSTENADEKFLEAVQVVRLVLVNTIDRIAGEIRARDVVKDAIASSEGGVAQLEHFAPWADTLLASSDPKAADVLFVVFPSLRGGFNCQAVPVAPGSFDSRAKLPEPWRGLPAGELQQTSGVADATFCHPAGFIAGATTRGGATFLAQRAIQEAQSKDANKNA